MTNFSPTGPPRRSLKCLLTPGHIGGQPAIEKRLHTPSPLWGWYLSREPLVYSALPDGFPAPRLLHAAPGVVVLSRLPGRPLCETRRTRPPLSPRLLQQLLDSLDRLPDCAVQTAHPSPPVRAEMRARLLEDPSAPLGWFHEGLTHCAALNILSADDAQRCRDRLDASPATRFCHGDLLLRNTMTDGQRVWLIDWECAGPHPQDWDRALLWASLCPEQRTAVEDHLRPRCGPERWGAFLAAVAFALAREVKFTRRAAYRRQELACALARIRA